MALFFLKNRLTFFSILLTFSCICDTGSYISGSKDYQGVLEKNACPVKSPRPLKSLRIAVIRAYAVHHFPPLTDTLDLLSKGHTHTSPDSLSKTNQSASFGLESLKPDKNED